MFSTLILALLLTNTLASPIKPKAQEITKSTLINNLHAIASKPNHHNKRRVDYDRGAVVKTSRDGSSMTAITTTITAPYLWLDPHGTEVQAVEMYAGIDTVNCQSYLKSGMIAAIGALENGTVVTEYIPYFIGTTGVRFYQMEINTGDRVSFQTIQSGPRSGEANIVNHNNGAEIRTGKITGVNSPSNQLCGGKTAEWATYITSALRDRHGNFVGLAGWGAIDFEDSVLLNSKDGFGDTSAGQVNNMKVDGNIITNLWHDARRMWVPKTR